MYLLDYLRNERVSVRKTAATVNLSSEQWETEDEINTAVSSHGQHLLAVTATLQPCKGASCSCCLSPP